MKQNLSSVTIVILAVKIYANIKPGLTVSNCTIVNIDNKLFKLQKFLVHNYLLSLFKIYSVCNYPNK